MNGYSTLHIAAILSISSEHPRVREAKRQVANLGSTGIAETEHRNRKQEKEIGKGRGQ